MNRPTVLITGSAERIGAEIAKVFQAAGYSVLIHYRSKDQQAEALQAQLNRERKDSCQLIKADIAQSSGRQQIYQTIKKTRSKLDVLIHNASMFYPTKFSHTTEDQWDDLFNSNVKAPYFLTQLLLPFIEEASGQIIFLGDIYASRPLEGFPVYSASKAAALALMQALAKELGPDIRVNSVSPGAILWPNANNNQDHQAALLNKTALKRMGSTEDIAKAVLFLSSAEYITGHNLRVDGGRTLNI